ncbi:glucosamine-6-phosphate deaminase [Caldicellulosiruptoraceae bacterium PP1]
MDIKIFESYHELSKQIAIIIANIVKNKPNAILCLAAGHTSLGIFEEMIKLSNEGYVSFDKCIFVSLDEWAGLGKGDDGSCIDFMYNNLFIPLKINNENIVFYDGKANLQNECNKIDSYLKDNGPIDFMLLGLGMNGHIGLNEPGVSFDKYSHIVELDNTTKIVGQKYFNKETTLSYGITMGFLHIKEAKQVILAVSSKNKAEIVKKLLDSEPNFLLPASYLKNLSNCSLYLDKDAAMLI